MHIPAVEEHLLLSSHVTQTFKIQVMQPASERGATTRFPVVYVLDANLTFDVAKGIAYSIQHSQRDAPRFMVVGIGYPGDSPFAGSALRMRDLTFPGYPLTSHSGAEDFQRFLAQELFTFIDTKYRTIAGHRTVFGHSLGGGFGLYTLFTQPELFKNYIVSSPGLRYYANTERNDLLFDYARQFFRSKPQLPGTRLYLSAGEHEEFEPEIEPWQLTSSVYRMIALIKRAAVPGLELFAEVFPRETHMTAWPLAFTHGVRAVLHGAF